MTSQKERETSATLRNSEDVLAKRRAEISRMKDQVGFHLHNCLPSVVFNNLLYEPICEKTGFLHMRKQRRRSASR